MNLDHSQIALGVLNHIPAMVAFWDSNQKCGFSNDAYREWFGKSPAQMKGKTIKELLGPIYELNLPYILAALNGERQVFERRIVLPSGLVRDSIATYTPDAIEGKVRGFWAHVADVTVLREREAALERVIADRDAAFAELKILRGLLPICAHCKNIRDENNNWQQMEIYVSNHSEANFSHGICPVCMEKHFGDFLRRDRDV